MSRSVARKDRFVSRMTVEDDRYVTKIKEILLAEPCGRVPTEPAQLLGHMYIGSQNNAESLRLLRRLGITHVLNCAGFKGIRPKNEPSPYEGLDIAYHEFKAEDSEAYNITQHFQEAFSFLDKVERKGGICLVHCAMGVNRSAATCVAYMLHNRSWSLLKTIKFIKEKRRVVLTNVGFQWQLVKHAKSKGLLEKLEEPPKKKNEDWFYEEVEYVREAKPMYGESLDRYDRLDETTRPSADPGKSKYSAEIDQMDILTKCINETLSRESKRRPARRHTAARDK